MLKNIVRLESIIQDRIGHFLLDNDCPIEIAEKMILEFLQYIGQIKANVKAQQDAAKAEQENKVEPLKEEPKPE